MRRCPRPLARLCDLPSLQISQFAKSNNRRCCRASRSAKEIKSEILVCSPARGSRRSRFAFQMVCRSVDRSWNRSRRSNHILDNTCEQFNSLACSSPDPFAPKTVGNCSLWGDFWRAFGGLFQIICWYIPSCAANFEGGDDEMKSSSIVILVVWLISPVVGDAQEVYRSTHSLEEQQAISQIGQAEYYARMALKSLEASEKVGKAPILIMRAREKISKRCWRNSRFISKARRQRIFHPQFR